MAGSSPKKRKKSRPYTVRKHCRSTKKVPRPDRACESRKGPHGILVGPFLVPSAARKKKRPATPLSPALYDELLRTPDTREKERPSIATFRVKCKKLFRHPIELQSSQGITLPLKVNCAILFARTESFAILQLALVQTFLPQPPVAECLVLFDTKEPTFMATARVACIDGTLTAVAPHGPLALPKFAVGVHAFFRNGAGHMIMYEAHFPSKSVRILDPNGAWEAWRDVYTAYFEGWDVYTGGLFAINVSELHGSTQPQVRKLLSDLGIEVTDDMALAGYCGIISLYYLIDYVCTEQWNRELLVPWVDDNHFYRASRDWLYSDAELRADATAKVFFKVRTILLGRYIAFELCKLVRGVTGFGDILAKAESYASEAEKHLARFVLKPATVDNGNLDEWIRKRFPLLDHAVAVRRLMEVRDINTLAELQSHLGTHRYVMIDDLPDMRDRADAAQRLGRALTHLRRFWSPTMTFAFSVVDDGAPITAARTVVHTENLIPIGTHIPEHLSVVDGEHSVVRQLKF